MKKLSTNLVTCPKLGWNVELLNPDLLISGPGLFPWCQNQQSLTGYEAADKTQAWGSLPPWGVFSAEAVLLGSTNLQVGRSP